MTEEELLIEKALIEGGKTRSFFNRRFDIKIFSIFLLF